MRCLVILFSILVIRPAVDAANVNTIFYTLVNLFKNVPQKVVTTVYHGGKNIFDKSGENEYVHPPRTSVFKFGFDGERRKKHLGKALAAGCAKMDYDAADCLEDGGFPAVITGAHICCPSRDVLLKIECIAFNDGRRSCLMNSSGCMKGACSMLNFQANTHVYYPFKVEPHLCYCCKDRCQSSSDCSEENYGQVPECRTGFCHRTDRGNCKNVDKNEVRKYDTNGVKILFKRGNYYYCERKMRDEDIMATRCVTYKTDERVCSQTSAVCAPEACDQINSLYDLNTYRVEYDSGLCYCCNELCSGKDQCKEKKYGKEAVCGQSQCIFGNKPTCKNSTKNGIKECVSKDNGTFALLAGNRTCCTGANDMQVLSLLPNFTVSSSKQCTVNVNNSGNCSLGSYSLKFTNDQMYCCKDYCKKDRDCKANYEGRKTRCSSNICTPKEIVKCENNNRNFESCLDGGHILVTRNVAGGGAFTCCKTDDPELAILKIGPSKIERFSKKIDGKVRECSVCDRCGDNLANYKC